MKQNKLRLLKGKVYFSHRSKLLSLMLLLLGSGIHRIVDACTIAI